MTPLKLKNNPSSHHLQHGFTLVEMAMVLLIVTLLLTGLVPTISSQIEQRQTNETRKQMDEIQQALIGYVIINERLPCPASAASSVESFAVGGDATNGNCSNFNDGFVPAATLGITPVNDQGFAVDAWNNRIHYAVTSSYANAFTTTSGIKAAGLLSSPINLNLLVCSTATGITASSCASGTSLTSNGVAVVIFSTGKNGGYGGTSPDEAANLDGGTSKTFVSHTPTPNPNEFDDLVIWISPNVLINRMVMAGKLP